MLLCVLGSTIYGIVLAMMIGALGLLGEAGVLTKIFRVLVLGSTAALVLLWLVVGTTHQGVYMLDMSQLLHCFG